MVHQPAGIHYILELYGCSFAILDSEAFVLEAVSLAARTARCHVISMSSHKFSPQGVTAVALLQESHLSIHTWPERNYAAADIFTCGQAAAAHKACEQLTKRFDASRHTLLVVPRGLGPSIPHEIRQVFATGNGSDVSHPVAWAEATS